MLNGFILGILIFAVVGFFHWALHRKLKWFHCKHSTKFKNGLCKLAPDLIVGMVVSLLLLLLHEYALIMDVEDASMDFAMQVNKEFVPARQPERYIPDFVLLDVDDKTHDMWPYPFLFTPRNLVNDLIKASIKGEARLIIVDINLSKKTPFDGLELPKDSVLPNGDKVHPFDKQLYVDLNDCKTSKKCPPIVLIQTLQGLDSVGDKQPVAKLREDFLQKALSDSSNNNQSESYLQWAFSEFGASEYDNTIRRWLLWQPVCSGDKLSVIPSIELLVATLLRNQTVEEAQSTMKKNLKKLEELYTSVKCPAANNYKPPKLSKAISFGKDLTIVEGEYARGARQRIMFQMPWLPPQDKSDDWFHRYMWPSHGDKALLTVYSAKPFLAKTSFNLLKDKVVLIGGSYKGGRDMHQTPLGEMPGGLVVINAIYSLLQLERGMIESILENKPILWLLEGILIVFVSFLFNYVASTFWKVIISGTGVTVVLMVISTFFFKKGIWIDFSIPIAAIMFHHIAGDFYKMSDAKRELEEKEKQIKATETDLEKARENFKTAEGNRNVLEEQLKICRQQLNQQKLADKI